MKYGWGCLPSCSLRFRFCRPSRQTTRNARSIIVPFPPGAGRQFARLVGQHLQDAFGQTVLIENRAGARRHRPGSRPQRTDGYTLLMGTNTKPAMSRRSESAHDPVISRRSSAPPQRRWCAGQPEARSQDLPQFLSYAKANPQPDRGLRLRRTQISIAQLQSRGGLSLIAASYRGVPQAMTDVMAG